MANPYDSQMHVAVGGAWQRAGQRLLRQIEISPAARVLDVGCGTGQLTAVLARCVSEGVALGIDVDQAAIRAARELYPFDQFANLDFHVANLHDWQPPSMFDLVFCNSTLHLVRPGVAATMQLARWVGPGGVLAIQLPARDFSEEVRVAIESALTIVRFANPFPLWSSPWYLPTPTELASMLRDAGLADTRVMEELEPLSFRSPEDAAEYFEGLLLAPYLEVLPDDRRGDFLMAFGEAFPLVHGLPACTMKRLYAIARRR